jgi:hypothetical protein
MNETIDHVGAYTAAKLRSVLQSRCHKFASREFVKTDTKPSAVKEFAVSLISRAILERMLNHARVKLFFVKRGRTTAFHSAETIEAAQKHQK